YRTDANSTGRRKRPSADQDRGDAMRDMPALVLSVSVWAYWSAVLLLALATRCRHGKASGVLPRQRREQIVWPPWAAAVVGWNLLPSLAARSHRPLLALPDWARSQPAVYGLRLAAACLAVGAFLATVHCWARMGRNWSIAVVPGRPTALVRSGL